MNSPNQSIKDTGPQSAPWFKVSDVPVVGIEHPYMISDIGRAIDILGGSSRIPELVGDALTSVEARLYFHPGNRNSKPVNSFNTKTSNLLVKVTVPARTGRKRKRGSDDPWQQASQAQTTSVPLLSDPNDAQRLVRSMQDCPDRYAVESIACVAQTHRFRRLPHFVWSTKNSPFMNKMEEHILPFEYSKLKGFKFDMSRGVQKDMDLIPPPFWTRHTIPFNYSYRQNPPLQESYDSDGIPTSRNKQYGPRRNLIHVITHDAPSVPTEPHRDVLPESTLSPALRTLLAAIRDIFAHRPIGTRRSVQNQVPPEIWKKIGPHAAKPLWQYVGFLWNSGPWRDAMCAFGVDPRLDREMRWYQTVVFQVEPIPQDARAKPTELTKTKIDRDLAAKGEIAEGHLFDGQNISLDGKVWQMCDITEPLLKSILETAPLREECDAASDGWYTNGAWAKIKVIMKAKVTSILAGDADVEQLDDDLLRLHQKIPDILHEHNRSQAIFEKGTVSNRMMKLAESVRVTATRPGGKATAWGPTTAIKPRKVDSPKKSAASGRGRGREPRRGSVKKQARGGKQAKSVRWDEPSVEQQLIDPRLRNITSDVADVARDAAMRAFEDDAEDSVDESLDTEGSTDDSSGLTEGSSSAVSSEASVDEEQSEEEMVDSDESKIAEESQGEDNSDS